MEKQICGVINGLGGRFQEPLACAFLPEHEGAHSWATLPTFTMGMTSTERAANRLLRHIAEFDTILSQEYVDGLDSALKYDAPQERWLEQMEKMPHGGG